MTNSPPTPTQLACKLTTHYTTPLPHLARARLLTGAHLDRLLAQPHLSEQTTARERRRIMTRLHDLGLVTTLARRIGGVRAGSAGHIYTLTPTGHRVLATLSDHPYPPQVKKPTTPGTLFLSHALAISDIYVRLIEATRNHTATLSRFDVEPACWQAAGHGDYLKPDAYCVLSTTTHRDCWWLEVDQGTESLPRIRAKTRNYLDYLTTGGLGPDDVPPRIIFSAPGPQRVQAISDVITKLATTETEHLICATTHTDAPAFLITELTKP